MVRKPPVLLGTRKKPLCSRTPFLCDVAGQRTLLVSAGGPDEEIYLHLRGEIPLRDTTKRVPPPFGGGASSPASVACPSTLAAWKHNAFLHKTGLGHYSAKEQPLKRLDKILWPAPPQAPS